MKIAILGGGNCYALNLARHLHALGIEHFGIGRSPAKPPCLWVEHEYEYYHMHLISDQQYVFDLLEARRPDIVVNFAAQGEGQASFSRDAVLFYRTNTMALVCYAQILNDFKWLTRFIQIGTSELYGSVDVPSKESDPIRPSSPYAISKAAFDLHLEVMHRVHGFPCNVIRPSNAITEGQQLHRIVPKTIISALKGDKLPLHGGGRARKSYIHADDLSRAILTVIDKGAPGEVYNCGPAFPTEIRRVVELCAHSVGLDLTEVADIAPERTGQDGQYWLDSSKLKALGWAPQVDLWDGIVRVRDWIKRYPELLSMPAEYRVIP